MMSIAHVMGAAIGAAVSGGPAIPAVSLDLTGCWEMGASNGRPPAPGCGTAPPDSGDGLMYLSQTSEYGGPSTGTDPSVNRVDACLWQSCYRPATGHLINTSTGAGMLRLRTLTAAAGVGNCTSPPFPPDGLLEHFNWILPVGWPSHGNKTRGTNVSAADLSGTFVNDGAAVGLAGGIFLRRSADATACDRMRALPDCTAVPPTRSDAPRRGSPPASFGASCDAVMQQVCGGERGAGPACMACFEVPSHHATIRRAGCAPPDVQAFCRGAQPRPLPPAPPESNRNVTGCYRFAGSAGQPPNLGCGMSPAHGGKGWAFVSHTPDGAVRVCLNQFCSRRLAGNFTTASNGVSFLTLATDVDVGNCTYAVAKNFPKAGLFAHIDFVLPAGWPKSGIKTKGTNTDGAHTISGMFVNNGPALAGTLTMDPDVDPGECDRLHELPFCADFVPSTADRARG
mmetsp:Transcript_20371/g.52905  ORF Transcript_20371/g.52905 Transcript_20371/m.52905 type:complete len:454 (+) Transcript_20371:229-1590(+)